MKLISHRGNIDGIKPELENNPEYIQAAINLGYDVEIDIRLVNGELFLGHDLPDYKITLEWLKSVSDNVWVHTKNFESLSYLIEFSWVRIFYHKLENHTIISNSSVIWSHNLSDANENSIIPLLSSSDINNWIPKKVYGICSDFIKQLK